MYGPYFSELQNMYLHELGRPVDLDGYTRYSDALRTGELTLVDVRNILRDSHEATMAIERKERQLRLKTEHNITVSQSILSLRNIPLGAHVVVVRYNESIRWIKALAKLKTCSIFLYNKGDPVDVPDVHVENIPNIGFEEYGYVHHLIRMHDHYANTRTKIIFLQCGLDHCPNFLFRLRDIDAWGTYTSLYEGIGLSNTWSDDKNTNVKALIPVQRDMLDIGGGEEYIRHFRRTLQLPETSDLYAHFCHLFGITPMDHPVFSPCAVFCVSYAGGIPLRTLHAINRTIEGVYSKRDYFASKVLASVIERLWNTIFIQN